MVRRAVPSYSAVFIDASDVSEVAFGEVYCVCSIVFIGEKLKPFEFLVVLFVCWPIDLHQQGD